MVGFTPSVEAVAESVGAVFGAVLDVADGEAVDIAEGEPATEAEAVGVLGLADIAGDGAVAVSSGFLEQLESASATARPQKIATGRALIWMFIQPLLEERITIYLCYVVDAHDGSEETFSIR